MFRRFVLTVAVVGITVGFAFSRDVVVNIKKVADGKVTFTELKKGDKGFEPDGADKTATATKDVVVEKKGVAAPGGKKGGKKGGGAPNEPVDGGLTNAIFKDIDQATGLRATITIDDDGANKDKITKILVGGGGGKKGGKKGG